MFAAFLFLLLCPLVAQDSLIEPSQTPRFTFGNFIIGWYLLIIFFRKKEVSLPALFLILLLFLFYLISLSGWLWAFNRADLIYESQKIILAIGALVCLKDISTQFGHAVLQEIVLFILICTYLILGLGFVMNQNLIDTLFGHKNLFCSFLFLGLPFALIGFKSLSLRFKIIHGLILATGLTIIFLLQTRQVIVAIIVFTSFYFIVKRSFGWKKWQKIAVMSLFFGVMISIGSLLLSGSSKIQQNKFTASLIERFQLWDKTKALIHENPLVGVGTGNWQYNYSKFSVNNIEKASYYNTFFKRPHNDFLWVLSENGWIGLVIILVLVIGVGLKSLREIYQHKNESKLIILAASIGLMIIAFFSFPKERILHAVICVIYLVYLTEGWKVDLKKFNWFPRGFIALNIVLLSVNVWIGIQRVKGEYYTNLAIEAQNNLQANAAIEYGEKALSIWYTNDPSGTPIYSFIGWGYHQKTDLEALVEVNAKAYELSPFDYKVLSNYGYSLIRLGQMNRARLVLDEAYRINSNYEPTLLNQSVLAFNTGNYRAAMEWLKGIKGYEKKYPQNLERIQRHLIE